MADSGNGGATAVITHQVRDSQHDEYERWLASIEPLASASPGFLDVQVIRPIRRLTNRYTVILRFDCEDDLRRWLGSPTRPALIDSAMPISFAGRSYSIHSGVDFLFTPLEGGQRVPVRLEAVSGHVERDLPTGIDPTHGVGPSLDWLGWNNHLLSVTLVSATAVLLMVYVIMPRYTRLVRRWLFR